MRIIFIFNQTDSIILIKALYEMACWLIKNRDSNIIFYVPETTEISIFRGGKLNVRWLNKNITANEVPIADAVISSDLNLLKGLSILNRGELFYLYNMEPDFENDDIKVFNIADLGIGIPERFFLSVEKRKKRVLIGGDRLTDEELKKILLAIEKVAPSFYAEEILIIHSSEQINIDTSLEYNLISEDKVDFSEVLKNSFYLIWVNKNNYPIIPLWAMASGVIVIGVNYSQLFQCSIEVSDLESMELALELMKTYKIGQYRSRILAISKERSYSCKMDIVGERYYSYLEKNLQILAQDDKEDELFTIKYNSGNIKGDYLLDIILVNGTSSDYLTNCLADLKKYTSLSHRIFIIENGNNIFDKMDLNNEEDIFLIKGEVDLSYVATCNRVILGGSGRYILLLNGDLKFTGDFLTPLLEVAEEGDVAVVGSKLIDLNGRVIDGGVVEIKNSFSSRSWVNEDNKCDRQEDVLGFNETVCLIKRDLIPILGPLDEGYLSYFEILDYSLRAREKGYRVVYCPESVVQQQYEKGLEKGSHFESETYNISKKRFYKKWSDLITGGEKRRDPHKIIVAGLVCWDYGMFRSQYLIKNLAKLGYEIIYINPVCNKEGYKKVEDNIFVYTPSGLGTALYNFKMGRDKAIGSGIAEFVNELEFDNCIIMLNAPYWLPILKHLEYSVLVYDCINNYNMYENFLVDKDIFKKDEEQILKLSDLVLTNTSSLYKEMNSINENTYILGNGFEKKQYSLAYQPEIKPYDISLECKNVGYCGPINKCFDIKLLKSAARKYKGVNFMIIGEVNTDVSTLLNMENIIFTGQKSYNQLADYIYYFDLAIIPLKVNEESELLHPPNLYEYIAIGKRVLTTGLSEVEKFEGIIDIADSHEQFIDRMGQLLSQEDEQKDKVKRYNEISEYSWYNRAKKLSHMIHLAYYDLYLNIEESEKKDMNKNEDHSISNDDVSLDEFLKISSLQKFIEDRNIDEEEIEVEVKEDTSLIKKIKNFFMRG